MGRLFFFAELLDSCKRFRGSALDGTRETQFLRRKLGDDANWLIAALRKRRLWDAGAGTFETPEGAVRLAQEHWVKDQLQYFDRASKRDGQRTSRLDAIGTVLFAISLLAGLGLSLTSFLDVDFSSTAVDAMSAIIGTSAGIGGVIKTYAHTMGYRELSGQYRQMKELYGNAYAQLETTPGNEADIFEQLWWEAVMENVEWYSLKTSRPVKAIGFKGLSRNFKSWAKLAQ
jgi:hypothetical protein